MTIRVCEANGGVLPRQVLIDTDGHPVLIRTIFAAKKGTSLRVAPDKKTLKKSVKSMLFMVQTRCEVETIKY